MCDTASYYTRRIPFIHLYSRTYTCLHLFTPVIHRIYTIYIPDTPSNTFIYALNTPLHDRYGRKLGGIRIGQLRVKERNCNGEVGMPDLLYGNPDNFTCYGSLKDNTFDPAFEDTRPFGRGAKNFTFEGT